MKNDFKTGLKDGLPICLGYLSVAFAFGIFAVNSGLGVWQTFCISLFNVTSAGQLAAVPIITAGGSLLELAGSQLIINLRYALMSVSLSQKMDGSMKTVPRLITAFINTDEVFAAPVHSDFPDCSRTRSHIRSLCHAQSQIPTDYG